MKFSTTLIAVRDMDRALSFYKELLDQTVVCDLGWCKTLSCGLTLQLNFDKIAGFPKESMKFKTNNMELYFETENIDAFMDLLKKHPEVDVLHELRTYPWLQRGVHVYDPDGHLIEVAESMRSVAFREFDKGLSVEETSKTTQHPMEVVQQWRREYEMQK